MKNALVELLKAHGFTAVVDEQDVTYRKMQALVDFGGAPAENLLLLGRDFEICSVCGHVVRACVLVNLDKNLTYFAWGCVGAKQLRKESWYKTTGKQTFNAIAHTLAQGGFEI